jgi:hypothetical protein
MQTFNYGSYIDTDPILRYYGNINNFNATQTLKIYDNTNINTDPIFRSYDQISNTGDDPFLYLYPYPSKIYDNYITNITNVYKNYHKLKYCSNKHKR